MTPYYALSSIVHILFGIGAMLIMTAAVQILIAACVLKLRRRYVFAAAVLSAAVMFLFQGITDVSYRPGAEASFSFFAKAVGGLPTAVVTALLLLAAAVEGLFLWDISYKWKHTLTPNAIKESLDALPDGICFFTGDGLPVLVNTQMHQLSWTLFGTELLNAQRFWDSLKNEDVREKAEIIRTEPTVTLRVGADTVWDFRRSRMKVGRTEVYELLALNITEQYRLSGELEQRNNRLRVVNRRLRQYSREIERVTAESEILKAKIRVHDDVGRSLLAFRSYLTQPRESRDRESLLLLWWYTVSVLKKETTPTTQRGDWELLQQAAQAVDVSIVLDGALPEEGKARTVCIAALHECLTNTVKHAGGNRLYCSIREGAGVFTAELTNNGTQPKGEIRETGGLKNLRHTVEDAGGTMTVETSPRFILRLAVSKGGDRA